jgi:hypothetical protein
MSQDMGQGRLPQAGRAIQKHMLVRLPSLHGGLDGDQELLCKFSLTDIVLEPPWTKTGYILLILFGDFA